MEAITGGGPLHIVVADDNEDAVLTLSILLELDGHTVHAVRDGAAAVEAVAAARPAAAILDLGMPRLGGLDAARRIRELPDGDRILLVALTGWGSADDRRRAQEAGFDHHLIKPVEHNALLRVLGTVSP